MRVIVVENHPGLLEDLLFGLSAEGVHAEGALSARGFAHLCRGRPPDLAIIDIMLPDGSGLELAQSLHHARPGCGIILLSTLGDISDRVRGLEVADAYLVKPVDIRELAAVVRSLGRRLATRIEDGAAWHLDVRRLSLKMPGGGEVALSSRECAVLEALAGKPGEVVSLKVLAEAMGERWQLFEKNRLELVLSRLRRKLGGDESGRGNPIRSARNEGYLLTVTVTLPAA